MEPELARHFRRNFVANVWDGTLWMFGFSFLSAATILPVYFVHLSSSTFLLGLIPALLDLGWFMPQLLTARYVERLPRKMPLVLLLGITERLPFLVLAGGALWFARLPQATAVTLFFVLIAIRALFGFAIGRKYLPKDALEEVEAVQQAREDHGEVEIFSPSEMREMLMAARPEVVPWLAIAGFAGLRSAELARLDWSQVNLAERHIEIKASKAKTAARRLAPITDNLAAWLTPHAKSFGPVLNFDSWWNQIPKLAEEVNRLRREREQPGSFVWKHNGLRHSFCSYRLAAIKNAAQVALEAGNSPQMIFSNYRQLVTEAEAAKWFSISPEAGSQIIPLPKAAIV